MSGDDMSTQEEGRVQQQESLPPGGNGSPVLEPEESTGASPQINQKKVFLRPSEHHGLTANSIGGPQTTEISWSDEMGRSQRSIEMKGRSWQRNQGEPALANDGNLAGEEHQDANLEEENALRTMYLERSLADHEQAMEMDRAWIKQQRANKFQRSVAGVLTKWIARHHLETEHRGFMDRLRGDEINEPQWPRPKHVRSDGKSEPNQGDLTPRNEPPDDGTMRSGIPSASPSNTGSKSKTSTEAVATLAVTQGHPTATNVGEPSTNAKGGEAPTSPTKEDGLASPTFGLEELPPVSHCVPAARFVQHHRTVMYDHSLFNPIGEDEYTTTRSLRAYSKEFMKNVEKMAANYEEANLPPAPTVPKKEKAKNTMFLYQNFPDAVRELTVVIRLMRTRNLILKRNFQEARMLVKTALHIATELAYGPIEAKCQFYVGVVAHFEDNGHLASRAFWDAIPCIGHYFEGDELACWIKAYKERIIHIKQRELDWSNAQVHEQSQWLEDIAVKCKSQTSLVQRKLKLAQLSTTAEDWRTRKPALETKPEPLASPAAESSSLLSRSTSARQRDEKSSTLGGTLSSSDGPEKEKTVEDKGQRERPAPLTIIPPTSSNRQTASSPKPFPTPGSSFFSQTPQSSISQQSLQQLPKTLWMPAVTPTTQAQLNLELGSATLGNFVIDSTMATPMLSSLARETPSSSSGFPWQSSATSAGSPYRTPPVPRTPSRLHHIMDTAHDPRAKENADLVRSLSAHTPAKSVSKMPPPRSRTAKDALAHVFDSDEDDDDEDKTEATKEITRTSRTESSHRNRGILRLRDGGKFLSQAATGASTSSTGPDLGQSQSFPSLPQSSFDPDLTQPGPSPDNGRSPQQRLMQSSDASGVASQISERTAHNEDLSSNEGWMRPQEQDTKGT